MKTKERIIMERIALLWNANKECNFKSTSDEALLLLIEDCVMQALLRKNK